MTVFWSADVWLMSQFRNGKAGSGESIEAHFREPRVSYWLTHSVFKVRTQEHLGVSVG